MTNKNYGLATLGVRAGQTPDPATGAQAVPIYQTTSYVFKDSDEAARRFALQEFGQIYSRLTNPTSDVFEARIAAIEGGNSGISTSSGLAAISYAILNVTEPGDNIVSADNLYGGTYQLFNYTFKDLTTGKFISINENPDRPSYSLKNNPTVLRFQREGEENNKQGICEYGKLYHYFYHRNWWRYVSIYLAQGDWNPFRFTVSISNEVNVYIEKWEQKGAGKPTGHFSPSKIEFTYAENIEKTQAVTEQDTIVKFMIEATTESYYQCVNRPEEALLRRSTGNVEGSDIKIKNIYWAIQEKYITFP